MKRTDRLLAIVLELQARKQVRAEDLAATFEVSKRTIYRDILALDESGVPIVAIPGQGYSLVEGYFLPPLSFTADEAILLLLGAEVVGQNFDTHYQHVSQSAQHKILTVLPDSLRKEVEYLQSSIHFPFLRAPTAPDTLRQLRQALAQRKRVHFRYHARDTDITERDVDPYALLYIGEAWMLVAYCHLRHGIRHFRLARIEHLTLLAQGFTRPADFELPESEQEERDIIVRAIFDHASIRLMQELPSLYQIAEEPHPDGLLVTFAVRHPEDMLRWLLGWGSHVRVLEPPALCELIAQEAEKIVTEFKKR